MNYIIDNIYLGDRFAAADLENLKKNNITTVVNCAREVVSNYTDIRYIELSLEDYEDEKIFPKFEVAYKFINIIKKKERIKIYIKYLNFKKLKNTQKIIY